MKNKKYIRIKINGVDTIIVLPSSMKEFSKDIRTHNEKITGLVCSMSCDEILKELENSNNTPTSLQVDEGLGDVTRRPAVEFGSSKSPLADNSSSKGCGRIFNSFVFGERICGNIEDLKHSDNIILCPECQSKQNSEICEYNLDEKTNREMEEILDKLHGKDKWRPKNEVKE